MRLRPSIGKRACDTLGVTGFGWRYTFRERPWGEVREFLSQARWREPRPDYLFEIIDSVIDSGADEVLTVTTSMHDLLVTPRPVGDPPLDVVRVCAPGTLTPVTPGHVVIMHLAVSGRNTEIERPPDEAVALFWRFMETEFGIRSRPASHEQPS